MMSLPARPLSVSLPPPPSMRSLPAVPGQGVRPAVAFDHGHHDDRGVRIRAVCPRRKRDLERPRRGIGLRWLVVLIVSERNAAWYSRGCRAGENQV